MKLVDMKQEPEKPKSADACMPCGDKPAYPYGLQINLDEKSLAKLGIKKLPDVGGYMTLTATVQICDVRINDSASYGESRNLGLQITEMSLGEAPSDEGSAKEEAAEK